MLKSLKITTKKVKYLDDGIHKSKEEILASKISVLEAFEDLCSSYEKSSNAMCYVVGHKIQDMQITFKKLRLHTWF